MPEQGDPNIVYSKEQLSQNVKNHIIDERRSDMYQSIVSTLTVERRQIVKTNVQFIDQKILIRKEKK